ncbi:MAG: hypothetical protein Q9160_006029 [Pyrenula sp. 1 TL-2023]
MQCECAGHEEFDESDRRNRINHPSLMSAIAFGDNTEDVGPNARWRSLITDYQNRQLTYVSDKLPAISGIAKAFSEKPKCTYIAGHWLSEHANDLLSSLGWARGEVERCVPYPRRSQTTYIAPSWSYLSIHPGPIKASNLSNAQSSIVPENRIIGGACCPANNINSFGAVHAGYLAVRGVFLRVELIPPTAEARERAAAGNYSWHPSHRLERNGVKLHMTEDYDLAASTHYSSLVDEHPTDRVVCWYLGSAVPNADTLSFAKSYLILVVLRSHPSFWTVYERIGYAELKQGGIGAGEENMKFIQGWEACAHGAIIV